VQAVRELSVPTSHCIVERDRLFASKNAAPTEMVVKCVADARSVGNHRDSERLEERSRSDAGKLKQLRRIEGAWRNDHLDIGASAVLAISDKILDASRTPLIERDARGKRLRNDPEIAAVARRF
jgi:hypothetical protein